MRPVLAVLLSAVCASTLLTAQSKKQPKTITLSGCVQRDEKTPGRFTLVDAKGQTTHRLTGADVREYIGRRVQVDGANAGNFRIVGGLQPNPNVAGQAGAMDPSRAAVAGAAGIGPVGSGELPEFRVKTVRPTGGDCK